MKKIISLCILSSIFVANLTFAGFNANWPANNDMNKKKSAVVACAQGSHQVASGCVKND